MEKRTARKWIYAKPDFAFAFKTAQNAPKEPLKIGDKVTLTKSVSIVGESQDGVKITGAAKSLFSTVEPAIDFSLKLIEQLVNKETAMEILKSKLYNFKYINYNSNYNLHTNYQF